MSKEAEYTSIISGHPSSSVLTINGLFFIDTIVVLSLVFILERENWPEFIHKPNLIIAKKSFASFVLCFSRLIMLLEF